ncbi:MAG TPA: substrate-binding domain-containing protein [Terriglobales bacterium]|nr:substrate-binding domain-containing protein [Terriglobales bacterium]
MRIRAGALAVLVLALAGPASAQAPGELRVCADPNNLPFSNAREEGFENRIAELLAAELGLTLRYTWWAQRRGFARNTVRERRCDVALGVPVGWDPVLTTRPYYRSTYVFVTRADGPRVRSLDDEVLRTARVGVHLIGDDYANVPPAHALARRGIVDNVVGFMIYGDYTEPNPPARLIEAVASGGVDVAIVWGPLAGYFAGRQPVPLVVTPIAPAEEPPLRFTFGMAMGVRRDDTALRDALQGALERRRGDVDAILDRYGVPRVAAPASGAPR